MGQGLTQLQGNSGALSNNQAVLRPKISYCLYARKSTEAEERQALSIDSQIKEMLKIAERDNLEIIDIRRESHSAKASGERPVFKSLLEDIRLGKFNGILTWAPDRLSRNAGDLGELVDLMDHKQLIEIKTFSQKFTDSPNEKFLLMILGSQAKLENDNRGMNVKRGLRTRVEMGLWPHTAPTGYLNEKRTDRKCQILVDPERGSIIKKVFELVGNEKWSGRKIYKWLTEINFKTINNKPLALSNVYRILVTPFYYGVFEYPSNSGNWYTGKHSPLISKELFDKVQEQLTRDNIVKQYGKEFSFTKVMQCGLCGSGITAQEKFKKQKNGNVHHYIYYGCTRSKDKGCKCGYIREDELVRQLARIMDDIDFDKITLKHKFELEMERFSKFQRSILGLKEDNKKTKKLDLKDYAKYILTDGTKIEQRELLMCLRSKITLKNKIISLNSEALITL
ncbi:MAG TPA: recombinase family protein [Candidatus Uhrbacteria bacterium]|nr:recombinase family protein [Candidatus Uhrbacteria bacterium]